MRFEIKKVGRETWRYFSKYHYLNERLPGGQIFTYGLFHNNDQIGFQCFANYVATKQGKVPIYHSNRTVIHPDYAGIGLGIQLINETSRLLSNERICRIMAKFSSVPIFKAMIKQSCWKFVDEKRTLGALKMGGNYQRKTGFREYGIKTYHFEFIQ